MENINCIGFGGGCCPGTGGSGFSIFFLVLIVLLMFPLCCGCFC